MNIGNNLRIIRDRSNVSQQEIADYLGIDRKTYISLESGTVDIKSSYLPKLAEFFHVQIGDLFKEKGMEIIINQHNTDNKDNSINGMIFFLTDKETATQIFELMKEQFTANNLKKD